jgi:hypothetical protein
MREMVEIAYGLLGGLVLIGGIFIFAFCFDSHPYSGVFGGLPNIRTPARWLYAIITILTFVIEMSDLPRLRWGTLLLITPVTAVQAALWPFALGNRIGRD